MIKLAVCGAGGRMGQAVIRRAAEFEDIRLVAAIERPGHHALGQDAGTIAGTVETGIGISSDFSDADDCDAIIDFTFHTSVPATARYAAEHGKPLVSGTTGLDNEESAALRDAAGAVPVVHAPNMSIGVNLLFALAQQTASALGRSYTVVIDETHHVHKKDAPSGTALHLGRKVAAGLGLDFDKAMRHDPDPAPSEPAAGRIVIRSHREGEIIGIHSVVFENEGERIELGHEALTRDAFARGAIQAARWITARAPGMYDMQAVLGL